jgi:hypothetical protein
MHFAANGESESDSESYTSSVAIRSSHYTSASHPSHRRPSSGAQGWPPPRR